MDFLEEELARRSALRRYVEALEEEHRKMLVFHRELPFSLELVSRVLEGYRSQLRLAEEEDTSGEEGPVLKEFIPTGGASIEEEEVVEGEEEEGKEEEEEEEERPRKLPNWLREAQLCDPRRGSPTDEEPKKPEPVVVEEAERKVCATAAVNSATAGGGRCRGVAEDMEAQGQRKVRRCWSPELHKRFIQALQQLGGSHVATPKQIREVMKVDGLTNDEVKSHLQKYRLHTRRGSPPAQAPNPGDDVPQMAQPQIVFISGIWGPPGQPEHPEQRGSPVHRIYAPIASVPILQQQSKKQKLVTCKEERRVENSDSSATTISLSSYTITTTESPRRR